ncbi:MAG: GMC family oxidoreductase [Acidobacteria bacterium]|nr:GMC family oxidoreductase [Acidobacteriota bacterium]MBI3656595.1 GMC family oxidoreductase [Acidobacteriota bacterium]
MIRTFSEITSDVVEEADVCIIGSGAGGAVMAKELAEKGHTVVVLEEGGNFVTADFNRNGVDMIRKLYRAKGLIFTRGLPHIALPLGRCVGGTTTINSGTCFRTPDGVLNNWEASHQVKDCSPVTMRPYFERVEQALNVQEVSPEQMGRYAAIIRRGADRLGYEVKPLRRNVRGCQGSGVCAFGCPIGAKQSMNVSYLPRACQSGARIYANCQATEILTELMKSPSTRHRRRAACGVSGIVLNPQNESATFNIVVRAKVVVVAAGAVHTPALLLKNRLCLDSGQVGKNLRIHPTARITALFDEPIEGWNEVPQSCYIDRFAAEGITLEGMFVPPEIAAFGLPHFGEPHKSLMKHYRNMASFGVRVSDSSAGDVRLGLGGSPNIHYPLNRDDAQKLIKGIAITAEIFLAAGAKKIFTPVYQYSEMSSNADVARLSRAKIRVSDLVGLAAFHPLGTCRMGSVREKSVVDSNGETHDVENLFISDASIFPTALGVNPQISIMAFSTKTAEVIRARLAGPA